MLRAFVFILLLATAAAAISAWCRRERWPGLPPRAVQQFDEQRRAQWAFVLDAPLRGDAPPAEKVRDAVRALSYQEAAPAWVNWEALALADGSDPRDYLFTEPMPMAGRRVEEVLLDLRAHVPWREPLAWHVEPEDRVLILSTTAELHTEVDTTVVDVRDLLREPPAPGRWVECLVHGPQTPGQRENRIARRITQTVDAASWRSNGGDVGSLTPYNGQLVITQSRRSIAGVQDVLWRERAESFLLDVGLIGAASGIAGLLVVLPAGIRLRRWSRRRAGLCAFCGYDLQASGQRCPECGSGVDGSRPMCSTTFATAGTYIRGESPASTNP